MSVGLVIEYDPVDDAAPYRHRLAKSIRYNLPSLRRVHDNTPTFQQFSFVPKNLIVHRRFAYVPSKFSNNLKQVHVQSSCTKGPLPVVPVGTLEIGTTNSLRWRNIPTTAALIGNKRKIITFGNSLNEFCVLEYGK